MQIELPVVGLAPAPRNFTESLNPVIASLRRVRVIVEELTQIWREGSVQLAYAPLLPWNAPLTENVPTGI